MEPDALTIARHVVAAFIADEVDPGSTPTDGMVEQADTLIGRLMGAGLVIVEAAPNTPQEAPMPPIFQSSPEPDQQDVYDLARDRCPGPPHEQMNGGWPCLDCRLKVYEELSRPSPRLRLL